MTSLNESSAAQTQLPSSMTQRLSHRAMHTAELMILLAMTWLEIPYGALVPSVTREALAELVAELRTNPAVFDLEFWLRHLRRLKPTSVQGWMGLAATLAVTASILSGISCICAISTVIITYFAILGAVASSVFVIASSIGMFALFLVSAIVTGIVGLTLAAGYIAIRFCTLAMVPAGKKGHLA